MKDDRAWGWTEQCNKVTGSKGRGFCQKYHALAAELASAEQSIALEARIADIQGKMTNVERRNGDVGSRSAGCGSGQARRICSRRPSRSRTCRPRSRSSSPCCSKSVRRFGMYIAFSQWRLYERHTPAAPRMVPVSTAAAAVAAPKAVAIAKPRSGANDNRSSPAQRLIAPETDVERFYKERIETQDGSSLTATSLYEDYCAWCEDQQKEPLALPTFGREFGELGVQKARIAGRVRYIGIALKSAGELEEDKKLTAFRARRPPSR